MIAASWRVWDIQEFDRLKVYKRLKRVQAVYAEREGGCMFSDGQSIVLYAELVNNKNFLFSFSQQSAEGRIISLKWLLLNLPLY